MERLQAVDRVYREDQWSSEVQAMDAAEMQPDIDPDEIDSERNDLSFAAAAGSVEAIKRTRRSLENTIRECEAREKMERSLALKHQWDRVTEILRQKENAMGSYLTAVRNIHSQDYGPAQRIVGWIPELTPEGFDPSEALAEQGDAQDAPPSSIWQMETVQRSNKLVLWTDSPVTSVAFSPNSRILASSSTASIRLWRLSDGQIIQDLRNSQLVHDLVFSPDGKMFAAAFDSKLVIIWSLENGRILRKLEQEGSVLSINFFECGLRLAVAMADGGFVVWNLHSGEIETRHRFTQDSLISMDLSRSCTLLVCGFESGKVRVWHTSTGRLLHAIDAHEDDVTSVAFAPQEGFVASGSKDRTVCIWSVSNSVLVRRVRGFGGSIAKLSFSCDGKTLASSSEDERIRVWNFRDKKLITTLEESAASVTKPSFSTDSRTLAWGSWEDRVHLWSEESGHRTLG
jgi:WD40 repeat protein